MNQKGFIQIPILIAIIVGVLVLGGAYVAVKRFSQPTGQLSVPTSVEQSPQQNTASGTTPVASAIPTVNVAPLGQSPNQPSGDKCGDSICDAFETANPNTCPQDCGGSVPSGSPGQSPRQPTQGQATGQNTQSSSISVKATGAKYKTVSSKPTSGWFQTGQDADLMLSGIDFNNTGGPLLFNHPGVVASDGTHLLLADRNNNRVLIWNKLPTNGEKPDLVFASSIGNVRFQDLKGVAMDDRYFYLSDYQANKVYIWKGISGQNDNPLFSLSVQEPQRLSSDGKYLAVTRIYNHSIDLYSIDTLSANSKPIASIGGVGKFNLPQYGVVSQGHLFVGDTGFNRVHVWKDINDAIAGKNADVILGAENIQDTTAEIGRNKFFWPAAPAFDGSFLWIGEFKFSERLLRFSVKP